MHYISIDGWVVEGEDVRMETSSPAALEPFDILSRIEVAAILGNLSRASVAILGDFCLDVYWTIESSASEVSLETGLRTQPVREQRTSPGGAGNVLMNLLALGVHRVYPLGVLGDDLFGRELARQFESPYVDARGLLVQQEGWMTPVYVKPYQDGEELSRLDLGNFNRLAPQTEEEFFQRLEEVLSRVSVVLINHQLEGSLHDSETFRRRLAGVIRSHPEVCFVVDSRKYHEDYALAVHKLNDREVMRASGVALGRGEKVTLEDLVVHAGRLYERWLSPLVVTRGERGCFVYSPNVVEQIFGVQLPGRTDPVGAGDTFVSALAAIVSTGSNLAAAAFVANLAAAVTAQKLFQTGTATPEEILEIEENASFVFHPELAESAERAVYLPGSEIEVIRSPLPSLAVRHAIFDHDGTISTLREGWEQIMEPMMLRSVLGARYETADESLFHHVRIRVRDFIERTTGIQTIAQMHGLVDLVAEFGLVPAAEIRSAGEYKAIFNRDLKALVNGRLAKLERGELEIEDFTLKGAVPFLQALADAGVRLYLASGTDEEDVRQDAERLGCARLFSGGI